ncbi:MAG: hypothetical protein LBP89_08855 [Helicobacteraceae bacterium]|jgi:hypothetical protein|nr:hypothetical protein [Helicobacteraceae bacterium]
MYRLIPLLAFLLCVLFFISGTRYSPSPLSLFLGQRNIGKKVEIIVINDRNLSVIEANATQEIEGNETSEIATQESRDSTAIESQTDSRQEQSHTEQAQKKDPLETLLFNFGYPFASGAIEKNSCSNGQTCAQNGVLRGINFSQLYCRAVAFSKGREMPRFAAEPSQSFESFQFWLSRRPAGMDAIYLVSDPFVLSGSLFVERGVLRGALTLNLSSKWRFPCEMSEGWQSVSLPLRCAVRRGQNSLDCSLDLRALIESLSGVAAKTSEPQQKVEIDELRENLQDRFKNRIREHPNIQEIDLRDLF